MRKCLFAAGVVFLSWSLAFAQSPDVHSATQASNKVEANLKDVFEGKIKSEWEALKNRDKTAYGALLADDYQGVEIDGFGEKTKLQSLNELAASNIANYSLWGYKFIPLNPDAAFLIYEVTMQYPPKSAVRFSRVYVTELWVKRDGAWKELHYQETHVK